MLRKLIVWFHKTFLGYEHDWTNDFYVYFYDKDGNKYPSMVDNVGVNVNSYTITSGQNPHGNTPFVGYHSDKDYVHLCWVVGHKDSTNVANWFSGLLTKNKEGAAIGIRSDYDQKTATGMPKNMNFAVDNQFNFNIGGRLYYTNLVWGMVGPDKWKVFEHTLKDVTVDVFKDTVMDELEIPEQIAETISAMDVVNDTKDTWRASEDNYYFGVYSDHAPVRKVNWGNKAGKDQSAIITPHVDYYTGEVSHYYILIKSRNEICTDSGLGNGLNTVNLYCVNF